MSGVGRLTGVLVGSTESGCRPTSDARHQAKLHPALKPQTRRSTRRKSNGILGADAG